MRFPLKTGKWKGRYLMKKAFLAAVLLMVITGCAAGIGYEDAVVHGNESASLESMVARYEEGFAQITVFEELEDIYTPWTFGFRAVQRIESLVEFTVLSGTRIDGVPDGFGWCSEYHYLWELKIDEVLLENNALWQWSGYSYHVSQTDDVPEDDTAIWNWPSKGNIVSIPGHYTQVLEEGQRYLAFLCPHSLDGRVIARINDDRSIAPTMYLGIYFLDYAEYTVNELREIAKNYRAYGYVPWWKNCPEVLSYLDYHRKLHLELICDMENHEYFGEWNLSRGGLLESEGIPGRSPQLYVSLRTVGLPTQNFRAAQGSTSWFLVYDASGEHPLDFWRETWDCIDFNAFIGQFEGADNGEIELKFSQFPPDTMYVRRWRTELIGMVSEMWNIYEPVEVNDNIIRINDSGYDYIYQVEARWERYDYTMPVPISGWASYTFRINRAR